MKRKLLLAALAVLIITYLLGPKPEAPIVEFSVHTANFPSQTSEINDFVLTKDNGLAVKDKNHSILNWRNGIGNKTEYALIYLHGFSASPEEGAPVHRQIAEKYGMNFYAPRLAHHGLKEDEALLNFSSKDFIEDAYEAIKIGELLGEKVIVMSCSTGGTASLYCCAHSDVNVHAQIMYSPNISLFDSKSWLLSSPWGLQMARLVKGGKYHSWEVPNGAEKYWHGKYRLESLVDLQSGLENLMTSETFHKVSEKTMVSYYYKDENNQDDVVSVEAIKQMISELGTQKEDVHEVIFTDVDAHALQSKFFSKNIPTVISETEKYLQNNLGIQPI